MTSLAVFTIANEAFLPGLAGLVNSLRAVGFDGPVVVGSPAPIDALAGLENVRTVPLGEDLWLGFMKPALILREARDRFVFLDADIVAADADSLTRLIGLTDAGPVLALEGLVAPQDHRRLAWAARLKAPRPFEHAWAYYNGGFLAGSLPRDRRLLEMWADGLEKVMSKASGYFQDQDFPFGDQDVLNAVLQTWSNPLVSIQFPDWWSAVAPHNPFLHVGALPATAFYHSIGAKPWQLKTVPPRNPTHYESLWFKHAVLEPVPLNVPVDLPDAVRRWLAGHWSGRLRSRGTRLGQRLIGG